MNTVCHFKTEDDNYYYYHVTGDIISVQCFSGHKDDFRKLINSLKATSLLILFEKFIIEDSKIVDNSKNVYVYKEKTERLKAFIEWGHKNIDVSPFEVVQVAEKASKWMNVMLGLLSLESPSRKELIFLHHCVVSTIEKS